MKPDRSNYEIWLCDWLDGNLNPEQAEELKTFLDENPDLRDELNGIQPVTLTPPQYVFRGKNWIKKSIRDFTDPQFDNLCIAYLENDLSDEQIGELNEITEENEDKRRTFENIQKLKLKPGPAVFSRKKSVKKLTVIQRTLQLPAAGLMAAATAALLISIYIFFPANRLATLPTTERIITDTLDINLPMPFKTEDKMITALAGTRVLNSMIKTTPATYPPASSVLPGELMNQENPELPPVSHKAEPVNSIKITFSDDIKVHPADSEETLRPFYAGNIPPPDAEYRSNVDRFLARLFHERILKDSAGGDKPVESFELAVAGITQLNRLLGWEMALQKNTGGNGELRSYYFTSKFLKINAPVKKTVNDL